MARVHRAMWAAWPSTNSLGLDALKGFSAMQGSSKSFIHVDGETTVPTGITIFGITGGHHRWTTIDVPAAILALPLEEQLGNLPELMLAYKRQYKGMVPFFGRLRGFKFVRLTDYFQIRL